MALIRGNNLNNTLNGTALLDVIYGFNGNDTLNGFAGDDFMLEGAATTL